MRSLLVPCALAFGLLGGVGCGRDVFVGGDFAQGGLPGRVPPVRAVDGDGPFDVDAGPEPGVFAGSWRVAELGLAGLAAFYEVTGDLVVSGTDLAAVVLYDLVRVGGDVVVCDNDVLANLNLAGLEEVGGTLSVCRNPGLDSVSAPDLAHVGGDLRLEAVAELGLVNLDRVTAVDGRLVVDGTDLLSLTLPALEHAGEVAIGGIAPRPSRLTGVALPGLEEVSGDLSVVGQPALVAIGLGNLQGVGGRLLVTDNGSLRTFEAPALASVGEGGCVCDNPQLSTCALLSLQMGWSGEPVTLAGNADDTPCD